MALIFVFKVSFPHTVETFTGTFLSLESSCFVFNV